MEVRARKPLAQVCWVSALSMPVCVSVCAWEFQVLILLSLLMHISIFVFLWKISRDLQIRFVKFHLILLRIILFYLFFSWILRVVSCHYTSFKYSTFHFISFHLISFIISTISLYLYVHYSNPLYLPTWESRVYPDGPCVREGSVVISISQVQQRSAVRYELRMGEGMTWKERGWEEQSRAEQRKWSFNRVCGSGNRKHHGKSKTKALKKSIKYSTLNSTIKRKKSQLASNTCVSLTISQVGRMSVLTQHSKVRTSHTVV